MNALVFIDPKDHTEYALGNHYATRPRAPDGKPERIRFRDAAAPLRRWQRAEARSLWVGRVSERAVAGRVGRRLAREGAMLHSCSESSRWFPDLGHWYTADGSSTIWRTHLDLEEYARELGVLAHGEVMAS